MMNKLNKPQSSWKRLLALGGAFALTGAALALPTVVNGSFSDNFSSYPAAACLTDGGTFGVWTIGYAGYGCVSLVPSADYAQISPEASTAASQTHAALVLGPTFTNPVTFSATLTTVKQLRTGSAPNPWEVGWVLWDYTTDNNFYAFTPQPNGWELTKEDPSYPGAQRYLATGTSPTFPVGGTYVVTVTQTGTNSMSVSVNGKVITSFTDTQTPYASGKIGLYSEDSTVRYTNVAVNAATATPPPVVAAPTVISAVAASAIGPTVATVGWTTNNPSSSQVSYGPTTAYGVTSTPNTTAVTSHSVALDGLTAGTVYHYQAISVDAGGNTIKSPDATFTTAAAVVAAPVISAVSATGIAPESATIEWTTNEAASGQVAYGPTTAYGTLTTLNTTMSTSHSAALSGLTPSTVYHYAVGSQAAGGPIATSPDATFTTTASGPPAGCAVSAASAWQNVPLTSQTGSFTATFQATPSVAKEDGVMGLTNGAASAFTSEAAIVRFNDTGTIDARNGGAYTAASSIPYTAGTSYRFQLVVNMKAHTYSAYVTPTSGAQQTIGLNYAFRTEQKAATVLSNLGVVDDTIGSVTVCNVVP